MELDPNKSYDMKYNLLFLIALGLLAFCVVVGNILVLLTFVRDRTLRNSTGILIISLALCDLLTGLVAVPSVLMSMIDNFNLMKIGFGCDFSGVLVFSCFNCSLLILSLISLQRCFLITKPHNQYFSKNRTLVMIIGVWLYSFGASMVPLLPSFNGFILYKWSLSCILDLTEADGFRNKYYSAAYNTLTFLIAGSTISVSQYHILRVVYTRTKLTTGSKSLKSRQLSETRRFYATKMISYMIVGFLICTIPIMILLFLKVFENIPPKEYAAFAGFMTWFNSLLNPIIYWYFNKKYSADLRESIKRSAILVKQLSSKALIIPRRLTGRKASLKKDKIKKPKNGDDDERCPDTLLVATSSLEEHQVDSGPYDKTPNGVGGVEDSITPTESGDIVTRSTSGQYEYGRFLDCSPSISTGRTGNL